MKINSLMKLILSPKKIFYEKVNYEVEKKLRQQHFIPIQEIQPNDVFLVAFPKSGITWFQHLIAGIQYGISTEYLPDKLVQEIIPDIYVSKYYKRFGDIKIFKSHELPKPHYKNVIYLVRDGRDAMVSYYHFNMKLKKEVSLKDMVINNKEVYPSPWWLHVREWLNNPYNANILFVKYEDLLYHPIKELKKISKFLNFERNDDLLNRIIQGATFDKMKQKAKLYDGLNHPAWQGKKGIEFFRKGKTGSYKEEMPKELISFFNKKAKNELIYFGYEILD